MQRATDRTSLSLTHTHTQQGNLTSVYHASSPRLRLLTQHDINSNHVRKKGERKKKKTRAKERGTRTAPNNKGIQAIMIQHPTMDKLVMGIIRVL